MKTIVISSRKGGVGKTTLSGHLAVAAALDGKRVVISDSDPQCSLTEWWRAREKDDIMMIPSESIKDAVNSRDADYLIVDTPPSASIDEVIMHADLVIIPVRPGPHDLRAIGTTIDLAERHGKRMIFVVSCAAARSRLAAEAAIELSQYGTVAPGFIQVRQDYVISMVTGKTALDIDAAGKSHGEITSLWKYIKTQIQKGR